MVQPFVLPLVTWLVNLQSSPMWNRSDRSRSRSRSRSWSARRWTALRVLRMFELCQDGWKMDPLIDPEWVGVCFFLLKHGENQPAMIGNTREVSKCCADHPRLNETSYISYLVWYKVGPLLVVINEVVTCRSGIYKIGTLRSTNIAMENPPIWRCNFLLEMVIFQWFSIAMLVYWRVTEVIFTPYKKQRVVSPHPTYDPNLITRDPHLNCPLEVAF